MLGLIPQQQQDKLTKFLDSVELGLLKHIWVKSSAFFNVLDDVRALETLVLIVHRSVDDLCSYIYHIFLYLFIYLFIYLLIYLFTYF